MAYSIGFRTVKVLEEVTEADLDQSGAYVFLEVTNNGTSDVKFYVNDFAHQGVKEQGIPIKAGTTRVIPMQIYKFRATGPVTVVAYRM